MRVDFLFLVYLLAYSLTPIFADKAHCRRKVISISPHEFQFMGRSITVPAELAPDSDSKSLVSRALSRIESRVLTRFRRLGVTPHDFAAAIEELTTPIQMEVSAYLRNKISQNEIPDLELLVHLVNKKIPLSSFEWKRGVPEIYHRDIQNAGKSRGSELVQHGLDVYAEFGQLNSKALESLHRLLSSQFEELRDSLHNRISLTRKLRVIIERSLPQSSQSSPHQNLIDQIVDDWKTISDRSEFHRALAEALVKELEVDKSKETPEELYVQLKERAFQGVQNINLKLEAAPVAGRAILKYQLELLQDLFPQLKSAEAKTAPAELTNHYRKLLLNGYQIQDPEKELIFENLLPYLIEFVESLLDISGFSDKDIKIARDNLLKRLGTRARGEQSPIDRALESEMHRLNGRTPVSTSQPQNIRNLLNRLKPSMSIQFRLYGSQREGFEELFSSAGPSQAFWLDQLLFGSSGISNTLKKRVWSAALSDEEFQSLYSQQVKIAVDILRVQLRKHPKTFSPSTLRTYRRNILKLIRLPDRKTDLPQAIDRYPTRIDPEAPQNGSAVHEFMTRNRALPPFNTYEEKEFFKGIAKLESRIHRVALNLNLITTDQAFARLDLIKDIILANHQHLDSAQPEAEILKDLIEEWKLKESEFIRRNLGLIVRFASERGKSRNWEVLFVEQLMDLREAYHHFRPELGYKFSSYAVRAIKKGAERSQMRLDAPSHVSYQTSRLIDRLKEMILQSRLVGADPITVEEFAKQMNISRERSEEIFRLSSQIIINVSHSGSLDDGSVVETIVAAPEKPQVTTEQQHRLRQELIVNLISDISELEYRKVLLKRYEGQTLKEIGESLGLSRQRVQQIAIISQQALKAVIGIRSKAIQDPTEVRLLKSYFGLLGQVRIKPKDLASEMRMSIEDLEEWIRDLLAEVPEEAFEDLLELAEDD